MIRQSDIRLLIIGGRNSSYNNHGKEVFRQKAMKVLREVRKLLGESASTCDVRFNAGGIAVSGEAILHSEKIYIQVSFGFCQDLGILVRTCKGRKDYTGNRNHYFSYARLAEFGAQGLAAFAAQLIARDAQPMFQIINGESL